MRHPLSVLALAASILSTLACIGPRDAGPSEDERGQVLFWEVTSLDSESTACTDAADFQSALTLPPLQKDTFFIVKIADSGRLAYAMDCTETRAESCTEIDGLTFDIDGHVLEYAPEPEVIDSSGGCDLSMQTRWTMIDDGDLGTLEVAITFPTDGDAAACEALDQQIAGLGTNGDGLMDCEATMTADLEFVSAD